MKKEKKERCYDENGVRYVLNDGAYKDLKGEKE